MGAADFWGHTLGSAQTDLCDLTSTIPAASRGIAIMDTIAELIAKTTKYPKIEYTADNNSIWIDPADTHGFTVGLVKHAEGYTVYFDFWHEEFDRNGKQDALNCFAFGLSDRCRLTVWSRGGYDYKWIVESTQGDQWVEYSEVELIWFPFWRKKTVRYLQNGLLTNRSTRS